MPTYTFNEKFRNWIKSIDYTLQMLDLFLTDHQLLNSMCNNIVMNKAVGIYDGAYKVVELAMQNKKA